MTAKTKSRVLEAVKETATDLHRLGFIDKRKQQKFKRSALNEAWLKAKAATSSTPASEK